MNLHLKLDESLIKQLPKADLHVHLDGSLRLETIIELAKADKIDLPSFTPEGLKEKVFKSTYKDLPDYLQGFGVTCSVMQNSESLERVAYEFAWDSYKDGVLYIEPRFAPQLFMDKGLSVEEALLAVDKGMKKAQAEINKEIEEYNTAHMDKYMSACKDPDIDPNEKNILLVKPKFKYSHIVCAMRMWDGSRSTDMIADVIRAIEKHEIPVEGIDLAGPEEGYPPIDHKSAYRIAHEHFMYKTVHAGEAFGPSSIFQAISQLYADRIGHGFHLFDHALIKTDDKAKACRYVEDLVNYIAEKRITLEVCLTSNLQTMPELKNDLKNHSFKKMIDNQLSVAICTDNRLVSNTTITHELLLAQNTFELSLEKMKELIMYSVKRSFYPGTFLEKKDYILQFSNYYDHLIKTQMPDYELSHSAKF